MIKSLVLLVVVIGLFILELALGSVHIAVQEVFHILTDPTATGNASQTIVLQSRLPRAGTAAMAGSALALAGLLMQTLFRNPLAGPSVMGISSGASLGVALLMLGTGGTLTGWSAVTSTALAAMTGAFLVLLMVLAVANRLADNTSLLIFGIMLSFFTSAVVDALLFKASGEALRSYVSWGLGSFAETSSAEIGLMALVILSGLALALTALPRLNLLLLGDDYAKSMGVNTRSTRLVLITATGLLAGIVTAYCGPVAFIGLAVPHLMRIWLRTSDHPRLWMPTLLSGAAIGLLCDLLARLLELPLNTIASALGAPVVLMIILRGSKTKSIL